MATLTVGAGKTFGTIAAAVSAAKDGDTVAVQAGTYLNDFATVKTRITLVSVGGQVTMQSTSAAASANALLTVAADASVTGFTFSGLRNAAGTGAGILVTGGNLVVQNGLFLNNQNGLVAAANASGSLTVTASEFAGNGNGDGFSHNVSVGAVKALTITGSYIHDVKGGDEVRSLAASTTISGTRIADNGAAAAYAIDLPNGGVAVLQNNVIETGAASKVMASVRFGSGTVQAGSSLSLSGNTAISDRVGAALVLNQTATVASLASNTSYGFGAIASGPAASFANVVAATRPAVSTAALVTGGLAAAVNFGRAGAVVASGHVLSVGAGQTYATVGAAVAAAADGDTIKVAAGTYVNDAAVINHKVILEGVGGLARFVDTVAPANGLAQFVTNTDVTLKNIEVFGVGTAVLAQGGNLTIDNSTIHDNVAGVVAVAGAGAASGSVGVFDSEIAANGTADGRGGNVVVGAVSTLTLQNDYVHDGVAGPEISSTADNTALDGVRVAQAVGHAGMGTAAGPAVALANGGMASVANSAIETASGGAAIKVGGGSVHAGSVVTVSNDVLISDAAAASFVSNVAPGASLVVSGSSFVGTGGVQVAGGSNVGAKVVTGVSVNTAAPWGAMAAPAPVALTVPAGAGAAQPGQLVVYVSGTAYQGNAKFTVTVDGAAVGGTLAAAASHAAGQTESFTIAGLFAPGAHTVAVSLANSLGGSLGGGSLGGSRALFVDGMTFNGQDARASATLAANGTAILTTAPVVTRTAVTVNLSEAASHGDALAFISIDGKVQGGVQTVNASHAAGQSQGMKFLVDLAPGAHTAAVTFLNPADGRALFVDSIDVGPAHYGAAAATLGAVSSSAFAFMVAPPPAANGALFVTSGLPQDVGLVLPHA